MGLWVETLCRFLFLQLSFAFHTCGYTAGNYKLTADKMDVFVPRPNSVHLELELKEPSAVCTSESTFDPAACPFLLRVR